MIYLTRRERFNAAHKLYKEEWSEEENDWMPCLTEVLQTCDDAPDPK